MEIEMGKKYRYNYGGEATILTTERPEPDGWCVISMTPNGTIVFHKIDGKAFRDSTCDLEEVSEWSDFQDGEPVMVRNHGDEEWQRRYFAGVDVGGCPMTYLDGKTKWSSEDLTCYWTYCRRPTPEELK